MLKSLSSGVSGLQAHQIAMDVESNNIANVNTTGFKYSRANFSNLLSQVNQIATAPQGTLGGQNATEVGLGTSVSSMTRIDSQGSIESTDKNTNCAIQGNGFFVVSADNGITESFTRAGDFSFDASGNFVDNNGYIVQGWSRNTTTGKVDSSGPIGNISIPAGLTTPAQATTTISLKANLDSGSGDKLFSPISALDSDHGNYVDPTTGAITTNSESSSSIVLNSDGLRVDHAQNMSVLTNSTGTSLMLQDGQGESISFQSAKVTATAAVTVPAANTTAASGDITINGVAIPAVTISPAPATALTNANLVASAINSQQTNTGVTATVDALTNTIVLTNDNSTTPNISVVTTGNGTAVSGLSSGQTDKPMKDFIYTDGSVNQVGWDATGSTYYFSTTEDLRNGMQQLARNYVNPAAAATGVEPVGTTDLNPSATVTVDATGKFQVSNTDTAGKNVSMNISVAPIVNSTTLKNSTFDSTMAALNGSLPAGSTTTRSSQSFNVPTLSSSIDVFDSLGSKHTVLVNFSKSSFSTSSGSTWDVTVTVPSPATLNASAAGTFGEPQNMVEGSVSFNPDGSIRNLSGTISSLTLSPNNGAKPNQPISLGMGTIDGFDGVTSFDSASATSGISQNGYTGGDLQDIRIDATGTLIGSFSNGRSFGLAQLAMATFANNGGLATNSGNLFSQSANSGDPVYGTASTGGRGSIQSSALEDSNVDLSRALTALIVIQRGYQANSKTITTSDQLLQTLIGLKT